MGAATGLSPTPTPLTPPTPTTKKTPSIGSDANPRTAAFEAKESQLEGRMESEMDAMDKSSQMKLPQLQEVPPPQVPPTDPKQVWGSAAMALAVIGSALTRTPLTTALNAAGDVMKAFQANDNAAAAQAFETWKVSNENAIKIANFQLDSYKAIMEGHKDNLEALAAEMKGVATAYQDPNMAQAAEMRSMVGMEHLMLDQSRFMMTMEMNAGKIQTGYNIRQAMTERHSRSDWAGLSPTAKMAEDASIIANADPATAQAEGMLSDADIKGIAEQSLAGDGTALIGIGRGKAGQMNWNRVMHEKQELMRERHITGAQVAQRNAEFFGQKAGERALGTREANIGMAVAEGIRLAPLALAASKKVDRSQFLPVAMATNVEKRWNNDPNLARFNAANTSFVSVYTQVMNRGGVPTENAREHAETLLSTAYDQDAYAAVVDQLMLEMRTAQHAPLDVQREFRAMYSADGGDSLGIGDDTGGGGKAAPAVGTIEDGHKFNGGDPSKSENWTPVQ